MIFISSPALTAAKHLADTSDNPSVFVSLYRVFKVMATTLLGSQQKPVEFRIKTTVQFVLYIKCLGLEIRIINSSATLFI